MKSRIKKTSNPFYALAGTGVNSKDQLDIMITKGTQGLSTGDTRSLAAVALYLKNRMTISQIEAIIAEASEFGLSNAEDSKTDKTDFAQKITMFAIAVYLGVADYLGKFIHSETELHEAIENYDVVYLCEICLEIVSKILTRADLSNHYYLVTSGWRTGDISGEDRRLYVCNAVRDHKDLTIGKEIVQASWGIAMDCNRGTFCGDDSYGTPCFYSDGLITYPSSTRPITCSEYETLSKCGLPRESSSSITLFDIDSAMSIVEEDADLG
tara:strand:+ start:5164 stop:5967 length:804 start_codon:yes stop_codon:yes gene_type:complete